MSKRKAPSDKELLRLYEDEKINCSQIAERYGMSRESATRAVRNAGAKMRKSKGENHGMWKGGRVSKGDGYIGIWMPDHPRADKQGYVYEHTLAIERETGVTPTNNKMVHHINCDKTDNRIENLYLCDYSEHKKSHWSIERLIKPLIEKGLIEFIDGRYEFTQAGNSVTVNVIYEIAKRLI